MGQQVSLYRKSSCAHAHRQLVAILPVQSEKLTFAISDVGARYSPIWARRKE